ncbi:hypothetical protein ABT266_40500, partial [Amycolatopsis sp. NPDC000746]
AVAAVLILAAGAVPANIALEEQDPTCAVFLPQDGPTSLRFPRVLVNAYAFGGNNSSLVLESAA